MREELLLEYSDLADGETRGGQLCPFCKGGSTGERSLSVSRAGNALLWKCHRASCGAAGRSGAKAVGGAKRTAVPAARGVVGRIYYRDAARLPDGVASSLASRYYFDARELSLLGWNDDVMRVVIPVYDIDGSVAGCVLRAEDGRQPKALNYTEPGAIGVFFNTSSDRCVIVEDLYSALRASKYVNGVAILGTHLSEEKIEAIRQLKCKEYILALDADAFSKTIKYVTQFRSQLPMRPLRIDKDIKNMTPTELEELLNGW